MSEQIEVQLGDVTVPVYPQRWAYLANRCSKALQEAFARGGDTTADDILDFVGGGAYEVLSALIPNLEKRMTRAEFMDPEQCPTVPEIRKAFRVACEVNEVHDLPGVLGKALGPAGVNFLRASALEKMAEASTDSPASPSESGESNSTSSTPSSPTLTESTDSPSAESAA